MKILKNYFHFSIIRIFVSCILFIVLFLLITNIFNLPVTGSTNLKIKESEITREITERARFFC